MFKVITSVFTVIALLFGSGYPVTGGYTAQTAPGEFKEILRNNSKLEEVPHTGTPSEYVWSSEDEYTADYGAVVYKESGREFKILNIADIHFSDVGYRILTGIGAEAVLRELVKETQPDLITLSGDIVCERADWFSIRRLTDLMEEFGIPWAPVFGNHDDEANCDLNCLAEIMMNGPHCLMKKGDSRMGCGNYVINIAEKGTDGDKIVETLIMTDSHHSIPNELQAQWVKWVAEGTKRLSENAEISLMMHVPLPEYQLAFDEFHSAAGWDAASAGCGQKHEKICCERDASSNAQPSVFFDVCREAGNVKYIFCSHDHRNDFSVNYQGIRLTYMMKIGLASGVQPGFDGGTLISVGSQGISSITHKTLSLTGFKDKEKIITAN